MTVAQHIAAMLRTGMTPVAVQRHLGLTPAQAATFGLRVPAKDRPTMSQQTASDTRKLSAKERKFSEVLDAVVRISGVPASEIVKISRTRKPDHVVRAYFVLIHFLFNLDRVTWPDVGLFLGRQSRAVQASHRAFRDRLHRDPFLRSLLRRVGARLDGSE